ncbi:MAG: pyruvate:ferredoxin (flavodoxin) oxidoreductase [Azospirillum sp.]|nr:pyruvate:ferredoxin (flavodoxin) oxidoreductase [Azospirillum sp.]
MVGTRTTVLVDGNEAAAAVAYRLSEVVAIYPITPASPMGELADEWAAHRKPNLWGTVPQVFEMQSEGGAAGAVHGALQAGTLATTFTASQGLLLMIPNLYKIAGELTPFVLHVAARTLATHALSIFGDHSDVMACRQTGFAMLAAASVQEAQDMAAVAHAATLRSRVPFLHFFDGFRTSHEINGVIPLADETLHALIDEAAIDGHRARALSPDHPVLRGTAQNPDVFFQAREACEPYYRECPAVVEDVMARLEHQTGRSYRLFEYAGHPAAERVVVAMGSGAETARQTAVWLAAQGERVGALTVRLYRPFSLAGFVGALPETTRAIAVLDRTKEPGALGEPLYLDVVAALAEAESAGVNWLARSRPRVIGGRYGLSSKEFTPTMVGAVFAELAQPRPKQHFTVGITDDVSHSSLKRGAHLDINDPRTQRAVFFGLGADGTVGANKNSLKIIAEETGDHVQGYFVYDSKKAGSATISHLRFGVSPIHAPYLIRSAGFVACHHFPLLERMRVLERAAPGAIVLLNAPGDPDQVWARLPREVQQVAIERKVRLYTVDASRVAREAGLGRRINTIMQTCFFALSEVMPIEAAVARIKAAITKTYGRRSEEAVRRNHAAVDQALTHLYPVPLPAEVTADHSRPPPVPPEAPDFVRRVTGAILEGLGDHLPVSAFPVDGTWPLGTARYEKRCIASEIPAFHGELCIQCNKCAMVCPHAAIRVKACRTDDLADAPAGFTTLPYKGEEFRGYRFLLAVSPDDCTGCTLCVAVCPAKDKANPRRKALEMRPIAELRTQGAAQFGYFLSRPEVPRDQVPLNPKQVQLFEPLFEYSGACAGCGETPYVKLLTQLFGDRAVIANATGCSSIYGGNLPTTPYAANRDGRGPAWSNSLFEDNAEFGFGMRVALDQLQREAQTLLAELAPELDSALVTRLLDTGRGEAAILSRRQEVEALRRALERLENPAARRLAGLADHLVEKSVWIVGGDGWAYDIGYGGLDHVLASDRNVNILVLDTEVYSNTGGQQSKATPMAASAKFAIAGRSTAKKDLGMIAMAYGHVYVARVAFGARDAQTVQAFLDAESYDGPSLIIAYSHCVAHGFDLSHGLDQQKLAVESGHWPLYRYDPRTLAAGGKPLELDSGPPKRSLAEFMANEARFRVVQRDDPERFKTLLEQAEAGGRLREERLRFLAGFSST